MKSCFRHVLLLLLIAGPTGCGRMSGETAFERGLKQLQERNYKSAINLLNQSIEKRPEHEDNARAWNYLGLAWHGLKDPRQAEKAFSESMRLDPTYFPTSYNQGILKLNADEQSIAEHYLEEASALDGEDLRANLQLGNMYLQRGQIQKADTQFLKALERARIEDRPRILSFRALGYLQEKRDDMAVRLLQDAIDLDPEYPPALFNLAQIFDKIQTNPKNAIHFYRRFLATGKDSIRREWAQTRLRALGKSSAPETASDSKAELHGESASDNPLQADAGERPSTPTKTRRSRVDALLANARQEAKGGNRDLALGLCVQAANMAGADGQLDQAEAAFRQAVQMHPDHPKAHFFLGRFLTQNGQPAAAIPVLNRALELKPDWSLAQLQKADAALATGNDQLHVISLRAVVDTDPENPDALWRLANYFVEVRPLSAYDHFRTFLQQFPDDPRAAEAKEHLIHLKSRLKDQVAALEPEPDPSPGASAGSRLRHETTSIRPVVVQSAGSPGQEVPRLAVGAFKSEKTLRPRGTPVPRTESGDEDERSGPNLKLRSDPGLRDTEGTRTKPLTPRKETEVEKFHRLASEAELAGNNSEARRLYLAAIEKNPKHIDSLLKLAMIYHNESNYKSANTYYFQALALDPGLYEAHYLLALIRDAEENYPGAIIQLENVLRLKPDHADAHYALGTTYNSMGNTTKATSYFEKFLKLAPDHANAGVVRAWLKEN